MKVWRIIKAGESGRRSMRLRASTVAGVGVAVALLLAMMPGGSAAAGHPAAAQRAADQVTVVQANEGTAGSTGKPNPIIPNNLLVVTVAGQVNMRACANTSCPITGTANPGNTLHSWCFVTGQTINDIPWWDVVYNASTGRVGFVTEALLNTTAQASVC